MSASRGRPSAEMPENSSDVADRYIALLRDTLTMWLWRGADGGIFADGARGGGASRESGRDWPKLAHSMIGTHRMRNIQFCVEDVLDRKVPGDFIETGVWRGGSCIFMRGILAAREVTDRRVWVADSFEGLPKADRKKYPIDAGGWHTFRELAVSQEEVEENFRRYGLLDDQVVMLKGFFSDSLPSAPIERIAVLRLDGDMYSSTIDALSNLYDKVSDGGYVIVDDYSIAACRRAIDDFRAQRAIDDLIRPIDWTGVFWKKGSGSSPADLSAEEVAAAVATFGETFGESAGVDEPAGVLAAAKSSLRQRTPVRLWQVARSVKRTVLHRR